MKFYLLIVGLLSAHFTFCQTESDWNEYIEVVNEKNVNSELSEFSPSYLNEFVVLVKANPRQKLLDKKIREPYFDLFVAP